MDLIDFVGVYKRFIGFYRSLVQISRSLLECIRHFLEFTGNYYGLIGLFWNLIWICWILVEFIRDLLGLLNFFCTSPLVLAIRYLTSCFNDRVPVAAFKNTPWFTN